MDIYTIRIDQESAVTKHRQLAEAILRLIRKKKLPGGQYLPGERTLSKHLGLSRDVVHRAYKLLAGNEIISFANHRGHRVIDDPIEKIHSMGRLKSFKEIREVELNDQAQAILSGWILLTAKKGSLAMVAVITTLNLFAEEQ